MYEYESKHDFLVGIDSDGCAFDTMELKHKEAAELFGIRNRTIGNTFSDFIYSIVNTKSFLMDESDEYTSDSSNEED